MQLVDVSRLAPVANADPEFRLTSRLLDAKLKLQMGNEQVVITIKDGAIVDVNEAPTFFDDYDISATGSAEGWEKMLQLVPPPYYQDLFPAAIHRGFVVGGNLDLLFGYYAAFRRLIDLLRLVANQR
jgi:hypothetical protein